MLTHINGFLAILATPMMVLRRVKMMSNIPVSKRLVRRIPKMAPTQGAALRQLRPTAAHFLLMQKVYLLSGLTIAKICTNHLHILWQIEYQKSKPLFFSTEKLQ